MFAVGNPRRGCRLAPQTGVCNIHDQRFRRCQRQHPGDVAGRGLKRRNDQPIFLSRCSCCLHLQAPTHCDHVRRFRAIQLVDEPEWRLHAAARDKDCELLSVLDERDV
jgi:hypothetical protein